MKKSVVAALTTALVAGAAATTFAAANPFSDVPAGHWAYNSVTKLAAEGVIEGYGDGTFLGNRNITRYEMAQMIAKALAKNTDGVTRAELEKLAAEFREELDNLGVRVSELEKYADKVRWGGKIEYTYHNRKMNSGGPKTTSNGYVFRLEPVAEINEHWTARARLDATGDMSDDTSNDVNLKRAWAQADYEKFQAKLGKFEFYTNEKGLIWDTEISGAQLTFGNKWKVTLNAGRVKNDTVGFYPWYTDENGEYTDGATNPNGNKIGFDEGNVIGLNVQYEDPGDKGVYGGVGYYHVRDRDVMLFGKRFNRYGTEENKASIWSLNLGYRFNEKANLYGSYARNSKADFEKDAWQIEFRYGDYANASEKGQWAVWTGYRKFGQGVSFAGTTEDDILLGYKGWEIGAAWAPFKNLGVIAKYGNNKEITGGRKVNHIFARAEFFF